MIPVKACTRVCTRMFHFSKLAVPLGSIKSVPFKDVLFYSSEVTDILLCRSSSPQKLFCRSSKACAYISGVLFTGLFICFHWGSLLPIMDLCQKTARSLKVDGKCFLWELMKCSFCTSPGARPQCCWIFKKNHQTLCFDSRLKSAMGGFVVHQSEEWLLDPMPWSSVLHHAMIYCLTTCHDPMSYTMPWSCQLPHPMVHTLTPSHDPYSYTILWSILLHNLLPSFRTTFCAHCELGQQESLSNYQYVESSLLKARPRRKKPRDIWLVKVSLISGSFCRVKSENKLTNYLSEIDSARLKSPIRLGGRV